MNKSESIRELGRQGLPVADIARRLGIRYQFARKVLLAAGLLKKTAVRDPASASAKPVGRNTKAEKPQLLAVDLIRAGFTHSSRWVLSATGSIELERPLPASSGVYAMVQDGKALYIGLATMGLAKRFYFYARPGSTQRTSIRINALLKSELQNAAHVEIYTVTPPDLEWRGLPVSGVAGLELGLIEKYQLPWNIRGVRP